MMKTLSVAMLVLAITLAPIADAKTCYLYSCNYIDAATNNHFSNDCQYWSCSSVTFPVATTCSNNTKVAQIGNYATLSRSFYVDDTYTNGNGIGMTPFKLQLNLYLPGDTDNYYDELTIRVRNDDTGATETFVYRGSNYNTQCSYVNIWLSNDYSNHNVTVTFTGGSLISHPWQVDNVSFFAYY